MTYQHRDPATIKAEFDAVYTTAEREGRELSDAELKYCEQLASEMEAGAESRGRQTSANGGKHNHYGKQDHGTPLFKTASGDVIRGYRAAEPINPQNDAPLGETLRALLLSDTDGLPSSLRASLLTSSDTGGGYLLETQLSSRVVDLARANSVVVRSGAVTVPMSTSEMALATVESDATPYWRAETAAVTASTPSFGRIYLRPRMCAAVTSVSLEMLEDSQNGAQIIEQTLMAKLGQEVDRALLEGSGSANEPRGVVNQANVNTVTSVGSPSSYSQITTAITSILSGNFPGQVSDLSWIMNPVIGGAYDALKTGISSDNTPLEPTPWARQLTRYYTSNLSADSSSPQQYSMVVGDMSQLIIGVRYSGVLIDVLEAGSVVDADSTSWNANTQFLRHVRARVRLDCALMQPGWVTVLSGVTQ